MKDELYVLEEYSCEDIMLCLNFVICVFLLLCKVMTWLYVFVIVIQHIQWCVGANETGLDYYSRDLE